MSLKNQTGPVHRVVALCYVRLSMTRDESDLNSPERQRANILAECGRRDWQPEWYEDVEGHKSGTKEENRPGWLALKARLGDPDVIAIVANDLSRLHRKGWRVGSLIDFLEQHNVGLVLAAPGRNLDLSGPTGKISTMIMALMDEYYATDTSQKQKDSVHFRRAKGVIVGPIPFGTVRNKDGYLSLSPDGVWLLPDGTSVPGQSGQTAPHEKAIWRGFANAAQRCLEIFSEGRHGRRRIAELLNREGYRYRNSEGRIVPFNADDARRITANWVEYGGGVVPGKAKDRRAKDVTPETVALSAERAVFNLDLCYRVGHVRQERARNVKRNPDNSVRLDATSYPLSKLVYCAHCEQVALATDDSGVRSYLTGKSGSSKVARRYRHDTERRCSAQSRSVRADLLERDFLHVLGHLTVKPDALPMLAQALEYFNQQNRAEDQLTIILTEIAHWRQRARNSDLLFAKARISEEDWQAAIDTAEHEIVRLQSQVAQEHEAELALKLTLEMVANLVGNWTQSNDEMRRAFASSLFEYLVYDLDARRIVDFKLKPWAELLMQLKITLGNGENSPSQSDETERVLWRPRRDSNPRPFA